MQGVQSVPMTRMITVWARAALCATALILPTLPSRAALIDDLPAGTGYAAWELCTRTIHSGDDFNRVRTAYTAPKVQPLPLFWDIDYTHGSKVQVQTWLPFLAHRRVAVHRPGLGCTLVTPDTSEAKVHSQGLTPTPGTPATDQPWPLGEGAADAQGLSPVQQAALVRHADAMFTELRPEADRRLNTTALLVAQGGRLIYERYGDGYQRRQPQLGWSMTKTVTALVAGLMMTDERISLDAPVGLAQWHATPKSAITWRQLLNMAPGLRWHEGYEGASDATDMLFSQADQGRWAADRPLTAKPGTQFTYSTGFSNIAMLRLRQLAGESPQAIHDYYQNRLFLPLGIRQGVIEVDASGTPVGGARGVLRPVDWLRLGQLVAQRGQWNGQQLIAPEFMDFMLAPSPASAEYGGSLWRRPSASLPEDLRNRLPDDVVWFGGHMGQYTVAVPSRNLVVVRTGVAFDAALARRQVFSLVADLLGNSSNTP